MEAFRKFSIRPKKGEIDFESKKKHIRNVSLKLEYLAWGDFSIFDDDTPHNTIKNGDFHFYHCHLKLPGKFNNVPYKITEKQDRFEIEMPDFDKKENPDQRLDMLVNLNVDRPLFGDLTTHSCKMAGSALCGGTSCPRPIVYDGNNKFKFFHYQGKLRKCKREDHYLMPLLLQDGSAVYLSLEDIKCAEGFLKKYHEYKKRNDPKDVLFFAVNDEHYWDDDLEVYFTFKATLNGVIDGEPFIVEPSSPPTSPAPPQDPSPPPAGT